MKKRKAKTISDIEFFKLFPDEASAVKFVEEQIWPDGVKCKFCGSEKTSPRPHRHGHRCKSCGKDFTVRHGTIFGNSRLPLVKWLYAICLVQTARKSISSMELSKKLGITQKSAWFMLHRIREACKQGEWKLKETVEVDETFLGGKKKNQHASKRVAQGGGAIGKQPVIGMRQRGGKVKAIAVENVKAKTLQKAIRESVEKGSTVYTDDFPAYRGIKGNGLWPYEYNHKAVKHSAKEYVNGMIHTNGIESVWALLKRGYTGTFHHFSMKHCQRYVDEFTFRLNEGNCERDTIDRIKSVCAASVDKRLTYEDLVN